MGMCLEEFGRVSIEVRRESFTIHPSYGYDEIEAGKWKGIELPKPKKKGKK